MAREKTKNITPEGPIQLEFDFYPLLLWQYEIFHNGFNDSTIVTQRRWLPRPYRTRQEAERGLIFLSNRNTSYYHRRRRRLNGNTKPFISKWAKSAA